MNETNLTRKIMMAISALRKGAIFRNNTGMGWIGESKRISKRTITTLEPGDVIVRQARPLHAGLTLGGSDLIGWTTKEVTPDMVGEKVALFTAIEVKTNRGRATEAQLNFIAQVRKAGGIAGIARNEKEAGDLINNK